MSHSLAGWGRIIAVLVVLSVIHAAAQSTAVRSQTAASADKLVGLWKAKLGFGPFVHGPLIIRRRGTTYVADMAGRILPVRVDKGELTFELPNGQGSFRGKPEARGGILGHWVRPGTPVNNGKSASPVVLQANGPNRWRGNVAPLEDVFTFYLLVQKRADGSLGALLRNPERDMGTQWGVERLVLDGASVKLMGKRGGKEQEVSTGTYDSENEVMRLVFPSRGGSYDFYREGDESDFYPRGKNPGRYTYRSPTALEDGWPTGTLEQENIDRRAMEKLVQAIIAMPTDSRDAPQNHALLIARHGRLVLEEYFHGEHRDRLHDLRSAGKSLTSIIVGAAMHAGAPLKLSSPVYQVMNEGTFPAGLEPQRRAMTLEHLLTMSSGYFCDDTNNDAPGREDTMWDQTDEPDFYRYTLKVPMTTPPGENAVYCSASPNLALGMVGRASGENPMYTFDRLVGGPMKIRRYEWSLDPSGHPYGGGGPSLLARDFIKLGQLMLNGGVWEGHRILSRDYAARAVSPLYHLRNVKYGYLWWVEDLPYKNRTVRSFSARGAGGQTVWVIPELDLVIGTNAGSYASRSGMFGASTDLIARYILPAVREYGDDPNAPVIERDYKSPYGASKDGSRVSGTR